MKEIRECSRCGAEYRLTRDKPGKIDVCHQCGSITETEARVGGNMIWSSKHAPELEIKPMKEAQRFNSKIRRLGAGVTASIIKNKKGAERELFRNGQWMKDDPLGD
jgi:hypothetical protein